jgi:hypothetical protein
VSHPGNAVEALRQLREYGLLLVQDPLLPSVATIVAGGPVRGSWLADPSAHGTYNVMVTVEEDPDTLVTKLVSGKVTFVHRVLWPAVVAVALSRGEWQLQDLSAAATWLLSEVEAEVNAPLQTDLVVPPSSVPRKGIPDAARELERRLLVHATEAHTPSGAHAKALQTWSAWLADSALRASQLPSESDARGTLETTMECVNQAFGASGRLPWQPAPRRARKPA